jgi:hypothetical protein
VGFVVDKVALGQVFSEYFGFPCQSSFHQLLHNHHHLVIWGWYSRQVVAAVPSGLSLTPLRIIKKYSPTRFVTKFGGTEITTKSSCQGNRNLFRESKSGLPEYTRAPITTPDDRFYVRILQRNVCTVGWFLQQ